MKQSVGVVLGGEGADELLCGYEVQHWSGHDYDRACRWQTGRWPAKPAAQMLFQRSLRQFYQRETFQDEADHYFALNSLVPTSVKPSLFQPWAWAEMADDRPMSDHYRGLFRKWDGLTHARKLTLVLHQVNLEALLARLDSSTMLAGLEARVPYTDHRLVEQMFRIPQAFKIDVAADEHAPYLAAPELHRRGSLRSKRILRSVATRLMPARLAHRKKASFPTPVADWLSGPWRSRIGNRLLQSPFARSLFQVSALTELGANPERAGMWLWPLLNLAEWGDRHFGGLAGSPGTLPFRKAV